MCLKVQFTKGYTPKLVITAQCSSKHLGIAIAQTVPPADRSDSASTVTIHDISAATGTAPVVAIWATNLADAVVDANAASRA